MATELENKAENRILFLSFCPTAGGVTTHQAIQINYLYTIGAKVCFVDQYPQTTTERLSTEAHAGISVVTLPVWTQHSETRSSLRKLLADFNPSIVVFSNMGMVALYAPLLLVLRRTHNFRLLFFNHSSIFTWKPTQVLMQLACGILLAGFDFHICVSEFTRNSWRRRFPWLRLAALTVAHNSVPISAAPVQQAPAGAKLRVGFLGRLSAEKDPRLFCEVARAAGSAAEPFEFHCFGTGELEEELKESFRSDCQFHGHVESSLALSAIDVLLVTSVVENCPFAVLEAKACGIPVVTAPVGGIAEILRDGQDAVIAKARTIPLLLSALQEANQRLVTLRAGCVERAKLFDAATALPPLWNGILRQRP